MQTDFDADFSVDRGVPLYYVYHRSFISKILVYLPFSLNYL